MKKLRIDIFNGKPEAKAEASVTIPFGAIEVAMHMLPRKVGAILESEGIDIGKCKELAKQEKVTGPIIEFETPGERISISIEL